MQRLWQLLNVAFAAIFLFGAVLQYNDPDPVRWMLMYLAAALPCVLAAFNRSGWRLPAMIGLVAVAWAGVYAWRGAWTVPFGEMFAEWEMKNQAVLETREMFGLSIIGAWMAVSATAAFRARRRIPARLPGVAGNRKGDLLAE